MTDQTTSTALRTLDWGRIAMVPLSVLFGALAVGRLLVLLREGSDATSTLAVAMLTAGLTACFYGLIVWAYLRRGPARATSGVRLALLAAPVATFLPLALPHTAEGGVATGVVLLGDLLLVLGLSWSAWALRCLDRSLSIVPQARELVDHGPYSVVRHPLYLGEIVAMLGLALTLGGALPLGLLVLLVVLQCYRAVQEEALLVTALPGYDLYRSRTARVLPGLF